MATALSTAAELPNGSQDSHMNTELLEQQHEIQRLEEQLLVETKIKQGAQSMLKVYYSGMSDSISKEEVELQLKAAETKIAALTQQITALKAGVNRKRTRTRRPSSATTNGPVRPSFPNQSLPYSGVMSETHSKRVPSVGSSSRAFQKQPEVLLDPRGNDVIMQDILSCIKSETSSAQAKTEMLSKFALLLKMITSIDEYQPLEDVVRSLRTCLYDSQKEVRAGAFRVLRHLVVDERSVDTLYSNNIDLYISRALTRDTRVDAEREQALKLTRAMVTMDGAASLIPRGLVSTLVAIAEAVEDKLSSMCLETLCELAFFNLEKLSHCGGMRALFNALLDATPEQSSMLVVTIVALLDAPGTRAYIRPGVDLEMIIYPFTDTDNKGSDEPKLAASAQAITALLKTWTGIIYLCQKETQAIQSLVDCLYLPSEETKRALLEMLFEVFRIKIPQWSADFLAALRRTVAVSNQTDDKNLNQLSSNLSPIVGFRQNLLSNYLAVVLLAFIDAGLLEALIEMTKDANKHITVRATILLGELLCLVDKLLPRSYALRVQSLPTLFGLGATFGDEILRNNATSAISHLEKLHRAKDQFVPEESRRLSINNISRQAAKQQRVYDVVHKVKFAMGMQIDDTQFANLIRDSLVLTEKTFLKWNWDVIDELLQGPLLSPKRVEESINNKFLKKLFSCFLPQSHQFSDLQRGSSSVRYVRAGCLLLETLLATQEGVRFLAESEFLSQLAFSLEELAPALDRKSTDEPVFSTNRMNETVVSEYFTLFGVMTSSAEGLELLKKNSIFNLFYFLSELKSRDDIIRAIVVSMNYDDAGHTRILLSKVLTSASTRSRLFSTEYMRVLLRAGRANFHDWGIRLLHTQVYDPSLEVAERALLVLEEACVDGSCLNTLVKLRPRYDHLEELSTSLMIKMLGRPAGFEYLANIDYIEKEMERWCNEGNVMYVQRLELSLSRALAATVNTNQSSIIGQRFSSSQITTQIGELDGTLPPHFYGELVGTKQGCDLLIKKKHLDLFVESVVQHETQDISKVKAALWALGHIGSKPLGISLIEETRIMASIIQVAETSNTISLRGTAFYVLGLISKTQLGQELLSDFGWETIPPDDKGLPRGIAVPANPPKFLTIKKISYFGSWPQRLLDAVDHIPETPVAAIPAEEDPIELEILQNIGSLSNHIVASNASKVLTNYKQSNPDYFKRADLYFQALDLLDSYRFRLNARKFVQDLFDKSAFSSEAMDKYNPARTRNTSTLISKIANENSALPSKPTDSKAEYLPPKVVQMGFDLPKK